MKNEVGSINALLLPLIGTIILLLASLGFGVWAYTSRQDFKNNSDEKSAAAVKVAEQKQKSQLENEFNEKEKEPTREYKGAAVFGSITFNYPKTWSGYIDESTDKLSLTMNPSLVSADLKANQALVVTVDSQSYDAAIKQQEGAVKTGKLRASAFRLEKLPDVLGTRLDGEIANGVKGSMIIMPLRDKSIKISTESEQFVGDLNSIILPSFAYTP